MGGWSYQDYINAPDEWTRFLIPAMMVAEGKACAREIEKLKGEMQDLAAGHPSQPMPTARTPEDVVRIIERERANVERRLEREQRGDS